MTEFVLNNLQASLNTDLKAFLPELVLCGAVVLLLLIRLFPRFDRKHLGWVALVATLYALWVSVSQWMGPNAYFQDWLKYDPRPNDVDKLTAFSGLLVYDNFTIFLRIFLFS